MSLEVRIIPILTDNYVFVLRSADEVVIVDPGDHKPVIQKLNEWNWRPSKILNTHHHWDHTDGNIALKNTYGLDVYCSDYDKHRIPGADHFLSEGQILNIGDTQCEIFYLPGHTLGHIAYYFANEKCLFVGDTLFSLGCGKLFEGTFAQLFHSLKRLTQLPLDTSIYCTHEYTLKNAQFALTVDPHNNLLKAYYKSIQKLRANNQATLPTTLKRELACNPFLRCADANIQAQLQLTNSSELNVFTQLRSLRNQF